MGRYPGTYLIYGSGPTDAEFLSEGTDPAEIAYFRDLMNGVIASHENRVNMGYTRAKVYNGPHPHDLNQDDYIDIDDVRMAQAWLQANASRTSEVEEGTNDPQPSGSSSSDIGDGGGTCIAVAPPTDGPLAVPSYQNLVNLHRYLTRQQCTLDANYDYNRDGIVNQDDFAILNELYQQSLENGSGNGSGGYIPPGSGAAPRRAKVIYLGLGLLSVLLGLQFFSGSREFP